MPSTVSYEVRYRLLKYVAEHPDATQRELASELGISLGKANYCLRALVKKGLVKVCNFKKSKNKTSPYDLRPGPPARIEVDLTYFLTEQGK